MYVYIYIFIYVFKCISAADVEYFPSRQCLSVVLKNGERRMMELEDEISRQTVLIFIPLQVIFPLFWLHFSLNFCVETCCSFQHGPFLAVCSKQLCNVAIHG